MTGMAKPWRISVTCQYYPSISRPVSTQSACQARDIAKLPELLTRADRS